MFGQPGCGNIAIRAQYGSQGTILLYCKKCGVKFSEYKNSPFVKSRLPVETIHKIIDLSAKGYGIRLVGKEIDLPPKTVSGVRKRIAIYCATEMEKIIEALKMPSQNMNDLLDFMRRMDLPGILGEIRPKK
jgi:hypothetical protein